jgi:hypothetical protein
LVSVQTRAALVPETETVKVLTGAGTDVDEMQVDVITAVDVMLNVPFPKDVIKNGY